MYTDMDSLDDVSSYLHPLEKQQLYDLGRVLGLSYIKLKEMRDSVTFRDDLIAAWLRKEDKVKGKYPPTWKNLVKALRSKQLGQNGIADEIASDKGIAID